MESTTEGAMRLAAVLLLGAVIAGCSTAEAQGDYAAPDEVEALIDDWYAANDRGDGSVLDLYVPEGYHLYGDTRYSYDEIPSHLGGDSNIEHEWLTDPVLLTEEDDGRYVVARAMRITSPGWSNASALLFEVVTTPSGELRIVHTSWFYDNEWSP